MLRVCLRLEHLRTSGIDTEAGDPERWQILSVPYDVGSLSVCNKQQSCEYRVPSFA
ncbi:hypothetical protein BIW11_03468 [Tropilaelaps mercedesae]|uniref:Uncharacterized protein n=1 Tax=Tropilaelaps mercedesae TaxID=418985 RepID=A0A1V9XKJ1_9ACAR|nr:hypothetical protein BIW11_03468 [Tropilaelaps mercedesae]